MHLKALGRWISGGRTHHIGRWRILSSRTRRLSVMADEEDESERTVKVMETTDVTLHRSRHTLTVRQLPSQGLSFQVWPAASALCWYLDNLFHLIKTKPTPQLEPHDAALCERLISKLELGKGFRVLELGAGTGMVGIAASLLGAHVTTTDLPHVIANVIFNASANQQSLAESQSGGSVVVKALSWGEVDDVKKLEEEERGNGPFDLILASDVVYREHLFEPLLLTLRWLVFGTGGGGEGPPLSSPIVLMAHLRRWKKDARFFKKASKFFKISVVHKHPPEAGSRVGVVVYSFERKSIVKLRYRSTWFELETSLEICFGS